LTALYYRTLSQTADLLLHRQVSPVEVTRALLERIEQIDGSLRSYATVMADHALTAARRAEEEIADGRYRGPLHGVPIAVKDLCFTSGVPTMGGAAVLADHIPCFDATVVARLEAAGAVLLGKLNLTEGAMGGYNPKFPIPKNPWDLDRWCGASSSGSAAATAAGLCYGSLGSDTGGSIRFPSSACSLTGLKPTWGRVSRYGVLDLAESLDHVGPMTRSAADAAIMFAAIAGPDQNDPTTRPDPVPDLLADLSNGIEGVRIGWDEQYATVDVEPEVTAAITAAVGVLEDAGARIVELSVPDLDDYIKAWPDLCMAEAVAAHAATYPGRREEYGPFFRHWLDHGADVTGAAYARANSLRAASNGHLARLFAGIDLLAMPTTAWPAFPVTEEMLYGPPYERGPEFQRFTVPYDYNGAPTLTLPCGLSSSGLPLSFQLAAKHLSEPLLCRAGHAYQQATTWHENHPPDWP